MGNALGTPPRENAMNDAYLRELAELTGRDGLPLTALKKSSD